MIIVISKKATKKELEKMAEDFSGYIKVVIDVSEQILAGGGKRHYEAEQVLIENGSRQENLWGGGLDLETKEIDYNSMINVRPRQQNFSRDIMSIEIRNKFDKIIKSLLMS